MLKISRHIACTLLLFTTLAIYGETDVCAQDIRLPDRWEKAFWNIRSLHRHDTVSICFLGDVMMHESQILNARKGENGYDFSTYFQFLEDRISKADLTIANMEFALGGEPYTGYPAFSAPDQIADYAADCGIDIFLAANNHIYDKGLTGAERTLGIYRKLEKTTGISFLGIASDAKEAKHRLPLIKVVKGYRLALLNFTYGTNGGKRTGWPEVTYMQDRESIMKAMKTAESRKADMIIALPHWGNEYELHHSQEQEDTAVWLAENGADLIIGTHPHVVQDTASIITGENAGRTFAAYSLGNAVSNMSAKNTQIELMITIRITRNHDGEAVIHAKELDFLWCSRPGGFSDSYTVIPVKDFIGKRNMWMNAGDYDNMIESYKRVRKATGITETDE